MLLQQLAVLAGATLSIVSIIATIILATEETTVPQLVHKSTTKDLSLAARLMMEMTALSCCSVGCLGMSVRMNQSHHGSVPEHAIPFLSTVQLLRSRDMNIDIYTLFGHMEPYSGVHPYF